MVDELDKKIITELTRDGRISFRELARRIRVSIGTILSRTKRLEDEGIINGYSAILNHERLGYGLTAVMEIVVAKGKLLEMEREVGKLPATCAVYDVTGLTDAIVIAKFRSRDELSTFAKTLLSMPFIERTNTHFVLTTVKEDFRMNLS